MAMGQPSVPLMKPTHLLAQMNNTALLLTKR